jgi:hypothetical protein
MKGATQPSSVTGDVPVGSAKGSLGVSKQEQHEVLKSML